MKKLKKMCLNVLSQIKYLKPTRINKLFKNILIVGYIGRLGARFKFILIFIGYFKKILSHFWCLLYILQLAKK